MSIFWKYILCNFEHRKCTVTILSEEKNHHFALVLLYKVCHYYNWLTRRSTLWRKYQLGKSNQIWAWWQILPLKENSQIMYPHTNYEFYEWDKMRFWVCILHKYHNIVKRRITVQGIIVNAFEWKVKGHFLEKKGTFLWWEKITQDP